MTSSSPLSRRANFFLSIVLISVLAGMVGVPRIRNTIGGWFGGRTPSSDSDGGEEHSHDHSHDDANSLTLTSQAMRNLGLTPDQIQPLKLSTYQRSVTIPAIVVKQPGRTELNVAAPMTGVIEHVHAVEGETVTPGTLLFEIRLTHEDLVQAQVEFLKTLGELDVERQEIARLEEVTRSGAVAGKNLLEHQYARDKLEALITAQRESLRLHGLTDEQVELIARERRLLRALRVLAPSTDEHDHEDFQLVADVTAGSAHAGNGNDQSVASHDRPPLTIRELRVQKGQSVSAGENLCTLANFEKLFLEGAAFEKDAEAVFRALEEKWPVTAVFDESHQINNLRIKFLGHEVDVQSRILHFFVSLENEILRDNVDAQGRRFVSWRYLPGQRLQLKVPVEQWEDQIVVPIDAIASEGPDHYVFVREGNHFDRRAVHLKYRDQTTAVIANDGSVRLGQRIAMRGAHQMQMAIKNKSGGAIDPHAGHNH